MAWASDKQCLLGTEQSSCAKASIRRLLHNSNSHCKFRQTTSQPFCFNSHQLIQMSSVTVFSYPEWTPLTMSGRQVEDRLLPMINTCERKTFRSSEAMDIKSELKKKNQSLVAVIACDQGTETLVGYLISMRTKPGNSLTLHKICIAPSFRRRGCARMLLRSWIDRVRSTSSRMHLWVRLDNHPARQLYLSLGFTDGNKVDDYYGTGRSGLHMILDLRPP